MADSLPFDPPVLHDVARVGPTGDPVPPVNGSTPAARHASWTGARHACETRSANILALRQLWKQPRTINEMAVITGLPVSSVCSLKAAMDTELEFVDYEVVEWGDGRKPTKRSRWQMRAELGR